MLTTLWLVFLLAEPLPLEGKPAAGFTYDRFRKARNLWQKACHGHGIAHPAPKQPGWLVSEWQVTIDLEGHYATPWTTREIPLKVWQAIREDGTALWQKAERERGGQTQYEEVALVSNTAKFQDYGKSAWRTLVEDSEGREWKSWRRNLDLLEPQLLLARMAKRLNGLQWLGESPDEPELNVLSWSEENGLVRTLFIHKNTGLLDRVETLFHHYGFGDQIDTIRFSDYRAIAGGQVPFVIKERRYRDGVGLATLWQRRAVEKEQDQPEKHRAIWGGPAELPVPADEFHWSALGHHVYAVTVAAHNARVFIVAFADHSVVLDAVGDSQTGEALLALVAAKLPDQPVTKLVISHFHPFYTWGIRPYVQRGVEIITTPTVEPYLQRVTTNPHAVLPDALFLDPQSLNLTLVKESLVLSDGTNHLEIYDIGELSNHTPEYLVTFLPNLKLLIQGDLLWMRPDRPQHRASSRARGLHTAIEARELDVQTIGTTIDHENFLNWVPMATLTHAVEGGNGTFDATAHQTEDVTAATRNRPRTKTREP
ncbi:MBL fold metallo-hydrolase [Acanthopleuribacter pedis]|uniref:MBL fold metallo-hydrolase n=1 Tax=Acanthopleuribacter pedis TaxID=442870 RepID=A0A8J7Q0C4_9BACT|nr:MBL fold metallo-hydrolase [Acanthopleuribacter pedis]MBO1316944.1 MBL fold metallo-hydrolase [Acanthopleuribacter pedis]